MRINEEFLNWCEDKWENEFKAQRLFSKLSNEDIDFLKDQYKADMIAILEELKTEIEEIVKEEELINIKWANGLYYSEKIIQQKIDKLKENINK